MEIIVTIKNITPAELKTLREAVETAMSYADEAASGIVQAQVISPAMRLKARREVLAYRKLLEKL